MSPKFRKLIRLKIIAKKIIQNRLNWPNVDYDELKDSKEIWNLLSSLLQNQ